MPAKSGPRKFNFTKATLGSLPAPDKGQVIYHDTKQPGLALRITPAGTRVFYVYRRLAGRPVKMALGQFPGDLTIEKARKMAAEICGDAARGIDPMAQRRAARAEMLVGELFAYWMGHATEHKKTAKEDQRLIDKFLSGWRGRQITAVKKTDVQAVHTRVKKKSGPYQANRVLALVRAMFQKAIDDLGLPGPNPAKGIKKYRERSRDRYLQPDELPAFFQALVDEPNEALRDFFLLALLVGARRGNLQAMRWDELNLGAAMWRIGETKSGETVVAHLPPAAVELLRARHEARDGGPWVFPSRSKTGHLVEPKAAWKRILERGGLSDLRIHDLRRSLGSWAAASGASLLVIGKALGHKSTAATQVYARLGLADVKETVNTAAEAMIRAAGAKLEGLTNGKEEK